jgi:hypothetical protein
MVVGNYGSGKTEVSVNLAFHFQNQGMAVQIADLDIVNPYFRSREARELMRAAGIRVVVPPGSQVSADLPIVLPEIGGMLRPPEGQVSLFDVGGDDVGARLLSTLAPKLHAGDVTSPRMSSANDESPDYALWQVINARRPFTDSVAGCLKMHAAIEKASRLKITGLIANTHLIDQTSPEVILDGWRLAKKVGAETGLPVVFVTAMGDMAASEELAEVEVPIFEMDRRMLPPWLKHAGPRAKEPSTPQTLRDASGAETVPAGRSIPIGRPSGVD